MLNPLDPTFLFLFGTFVSVLFIDADDVAKTLSVKVPSADEAITYFTDRAVLVGVFELLCFLWFTRGAKQALTRLGR